MIEIFSATTLALAFYLAKPIRQFEKTKVRIRKAKETPKLDISIDKTRAVSELIVLALAAGMTVPAAIALVAKESDSDFAKELGLVFKNHQLGGNLSYELNQLASLDKYWSLVVKLLQQSWQRGSTILENLTELNDYLVELERSNVLRKVKRAGVLSVLPLGFCFLPAFGLVVVLPLIGSLFSF